MNRAIGMTPLLLAASLLAGACQSAPRNGYAVLASTDADTMTTVRLTLARAMNVASVEIGPGDLSAQSTISVLPPPPSSNEDRSTVMPTQFDIMLKDGACVVVRRDTGEAFALDGVKCRPLDR